MLVSIQINGGVGRRGWIPTMNGCKEKELSPYVNSHFDLLSYLILLLPDNIKIPFSFTLCNLRTKYSEKTEFFLRKMFHSVEIEMGCSNNVAPLI